MRVQAAIVDGANETYEIARRNLAGLREEQEKTSDAVTAANDALKEQARIAEFLGVNMKEAARIIALDTVEANKAALQSTLEFFADVIPRAREFGLQFQSLGQDFEDLSVKQENAFKRIAENFITLNEETQQRIVEQANFITTGLDDQLKFITQATKFQIAEQRKLATFEKKQQAARQAANINFLKAGVTLLKAILPQQFAESKAFAVGEAIIQGTLAVQKALASAPPPANFALAASVAAISAANIAAIIAAKPGTGGGIPAVGGGGGGMGGPAGGVELAEPTFPAAPAINIVVEGFIGDERTLADELSRVLRESQGDGVELTLGT